MIKYLAILRDSLREALDSKVMYVLMGLSTLVILFVGTFSFTPVSAERTMELFFMAGKGVPIFVALNNHKPEKMDELMVRQAGPLMQFQLDKVELLRGDPDSPESDYLLTLSPRGNPVVIDFLDKGRDQPADLKSIREIFKDAEDLGYVQIADPKMIPDPKNPKRNAYQVTVKGTSRTFRIWGAQPSLFFGAVPIGEFAAPLGFQIYFLTSLVLSIGTWVAVLTGVVITSFFIPNMLRKGTVDLLLVKPIQRWVLLVYKYIGGLAFIFLTTCYTLGGIWLMLGIRTGLWANWSLLLVFTITFFFAILYSISTFVGVLTRSTITAIMITIGAWFAFFVIGAVQSHLQSQYLIEQEREKRNNPVPEEHRMGDGVLANVAKSLHAITPRTSDLSHLNDLIVYTDFMTGSLTDMEKFDTAKRNWGMSILVSTLWIVVFLALASAWFTYRDY